MQSNDWNETIVAEAKTIQDGNLIWWRPDGKINYGTPDTDPAKYIQVENT